MLDAHASSANGLLRRCLVRRPRNDSASAVKSKWREGLNGAPVSLASRDRILAPLVGTEMGKAFAIRANLVLRIQWLLPPVTRQVALGMIRRGLQREGGRMKRGVRIVVSLSPRLRPSCCEARGGRLCVSEIFAVFSGKRLSCR